MNYSEWMRRYRRLIGLPFLLAALLLADFSTAYLWIGIPLVIAGESLRIWAAGHLQKEKILTTGGPYRFLRNPLYLGSLLIAIGFFFLTPSYWIIALIAIYFLICYVPVVAYEERVLMEKFPDDFPAYSSEIPAFFPAFHVWKSPSSRFSWQQVWKNKEYNAILGIIVFLVVLAIFRR